MTRLSLTLVTDGSTCSFYFRPFTDAECRVLVSQTHTIVQEVAQQQVQEGAQQQPPEGTIAPKQKRNISASTF